MNLRLDKWLWAARFFKTRSLASEAVAAHRVLVNDKEIKPAYMLKIGDFIQIKQKEWTITVEVLALLDKRGPAKIAQTLYNETAESVENRLKIKELQKFQKEPAAGFHGRPEKKDRRQWEKLMQQLKT